MRTWVYRVAHNTATSKVLRPKTNAPSVVALDNSLEAVAAAASEEAALDQRRAFERLHDLVSRHRPIDRQVSC